jgi:hypothetical protein
LELSSAARRSCPNPTDLRNDGKPKANRMKKVAFCNRSWHSGPS